MDLDNLSKEDLLQIITNMRKLSEPEGYTDTLILEAINIDPPVPLKHLCDWIHAVVCGREHGECEYYSEEELSTCWSEIEHKFWMDILKNLMKELDLSVDELRTLTGYFRYLSQEASSRSRMQGAGKLGQFLNWVLSRRHDALLPIPLPRPHPETTLRPASISSLMDELLDSELGS